MAIIAYKLLKKYPGLDKNAEIGDYLTEENIGFNITVYNIKFFKMSCFFNRQNYQVNKELVENNPDYFEKCNLEVIIKELKNDTSN